jgi:hypothetical protein
MCSTRNVLPAIALPETELSDIFKTVTGQSINTLYWTHVADVRKPCSAMEHGEGFEGPHAEPVGAVCAVLLAVLGQAAGCTQQQWSQLLERLHGLCLLLITAGPPCWPSTSPQVASLP